MQMIVTLSLGERNVYFIDVNGVKDTSYGAPILTHPKL